MTDMHIDHKVLSDLREVMEDGFLQLVKTFLDDSERRLSQLHAAKSAEELGAAAHSFKGSSSNMGAVALARLCQQLEDRARQRPLYGIEDLINRIDLEYGVVQRFYRDEQQRISAG
ncbi:MULTISPECIES: Hpt domain-containing protein [Pseudomonas]|uniref:Hpt domain-containing protein n=2 Tax=Pseudomonas TaxID=286 RepID=A0A1L7NHF2_PSEPU|nr:MULTISPECIES: Hpt domain-containing protein [Pseudomonas]MBP2081977.1 HPt (histidine-containing phosphotransfer) domain-containing protein [Pseudomonas sp. PvP089]MBP2092404.1 HPt (histidine-containing phosphotransfer) domain-containing protein [Pseudomonas sp. PvP088]MCE0781753.1 Hpt domain-containing protein [Pseudomonas sp. NMI542_15]MCE0968254.1 Hpt domain-containing protein [Pseudomonas sp. NMI4491_12]PNB54494.1 histidine kinase [Pseudomonas sp. FW305-130]